MSNNVDERVTKLESVFTSRHASFESYKNAYEDFAQHAVVENAFFRNWYDILEREKDNPVFESGWQKIYFNCYQSMGILLRDDYTVERKRAKLPEIILQILRANMLFETENKQDRCLIIAAFIDFITAISDGDDKIIYPAGTYKIITTLCQEESFRNYYGEEAAKTVVNRTIRSVFDLQKYGGENHLIPGQMICEIMVGDNASSGVQDFCRVMLRTDDPKMAQVLNNSSDYTMKDINAGKNIVQNLAGEVTPQKMDFKSTWTVLFGVMVVCIGIVAFSIGRMTGDDGSAQAAALESQVAVYQQAAESYSIEKDALESENSVLQSQIAAGIETEAAIESASETASDSASDSEETEASEESEETKEPSGEGDDAVADEYWTIPSEINMREDPEIVSGNVMYVLEEGDEVYVVAGKDADGWITVIYDGDQGYINFDN